MSYSRWSCSDWYAFHTTESGETKETQKLALWYAGADDNPIYTYEELKTITPDIIRERCDMEISESNMEEALYIIKQFIIDVDDEFNPDKK